MSKERIKPSQFCIFDGSLLNSEVISDISQNDKDELGVLYARQTQEYKKNKIVSATVVSKKSDEVEVTIKYKSNGIISAYEFNPTEYSELTPGSVIDVIIEELESAQGAVVLSYQRAKEAKAWDKIVHSYKENKPVDGIVTGKVKGGLYVDVGITAFLPGSQIDVQRVTNFDQWIGQKIQAYVIKLMPRRGNVIVSRRKFIYEQKSESRKCVISNLSEGQVINGTVKNITKYGAFVDIGGVDGLLHITDMTWSRIDDPTEIIAIGDVIPVKILSFDKANEKVSLGMKQLSENPWEELSESVNVGAIIKGIVTSIKDYGIFVEVAKGVEGLVHISEVSWTDRINDPAKHFTVGQEISAVVVSLERKNRRMSLSVKQLDKNPWDAIFEQYQIGQKISGKITNIADFGFFVQLTPGVDGLVYISDISWTQHIKHPSDLYKKDDIVNAVITDINKQKRKISLSIKALQENPWNKIAEKLPAGSYISGTVTKVADFGAFVRLQNFDIEAFIHVSEASDTPNVSINDVLEVGKEYNFKVLRVLPEEQKIGLSLRKEEKRFSGNNNNKSSGSHSHHQSSFSGEHKKKREGDSSAGYNRNKSDSKYTQSDSSSSSSNNTKQKSSLQRELERIMNEKKDSK